ncbi:hypothetical protein RZP29_23635 [Klebsiella quasipneumoniae subsp. similipneumoniae]|uniref:Morphogenetic protein n=1 Tax=Klebsiella quasipneumoniae subsp. similipneumoniae TaxID=1463164 RepID=A0AAE4MVJ3_9ENTR|nr:MULTISPECIES: hypothetical protein [Enterobacteriaceae]HDS9265288.1 hypothetical protein [Klebsiella pneumoniae subsp. pneumoniae]MCC4943960.1 hypothetical protein [Klebsiella pneumoniae]MCC4949466.1 hypothetical protein [Klebsiella pneumoniae]MCC4970303.1 hypothetical protein [Klebsiella pneumoniae]MCC4975449.1 hypothetical protein [Klebsiella pneumoniae]
MKERGMIFNGEMVRAILDGRKTQTRRIMKPQPKPSKSRPGDFWFSSKKLESMVHVSDLAPGNSPIADYHLFIQEHCCPFGAVGDRIWVRETFSPVDDTQYGGEKWVDYRATPKFEASHPAGWDCAPNDAEALKWRPSIHMPRWASRILLEITNVRVERLKSISDGDAIREGCSTTDMKSGDCVADVFARLWASIYGDESWNSNPWVWVIEFKRVEGGAA